MERHISKWEEFFYGPKNPCGIKDCPECYPDSKKRFVTSIVNRIKLRRNMARVRRQLSSLASKANAKDNVV